MVEGITRRHGGTEQGRAELSLANRGGRAQTNDMGMFEINDASTPRSWDASPRMLLAAAVVAIFAAVAGCGKAPAHPRESNQDHRETQPHASTVETPAVEASRPVEVVTTEQSPLAVESPTTTAAPPQAGSRRKSLAESLPQQENAEPGQTGVSFRPAPLPEIDENRIAVAGIRKLEGKRLTLYTDLPSQPAVDELPHVFDLAVPQWRQYFGVDPARVGQWRMRGYVMARKEAFAGTGLLPADLPPFLHGFHRGSELWLYEQPSDYYRRHLLLHEGTHGFMKSFLGGAGPPWYLEGTAELLGTHRWKNGVLEMGYFPRSRDETPMWGRIKIVQDDFAAHRGLTLSNVFAMGPRAHLEREPYGWSWAAAAFFDGHPRTQAAFRALKDQVRLGEPGFSEKLRAGLGDEWLHALEEWQLFVSHLEYGYDVGREAVEFRPGAPLPAAGQTVALAADRGWQSSGLLVEEGKSYRLTASGRYTVAQAPQPWECEPNGVTIRYHRELPLGILLGTVRPEGFAEGQVSAFLKPGPIGTGRTIRAPGTGVLYFRINDSPAELADNQGEITVRIEPAL